MPQNLILDITGNEKVARNIYRMSFFQHDLAEIITPGQFLMLKFPGNASDPLLRRPFSIHRVDGRSGRIDILYKVNGRCTTLMSEQKPGDRIDILAPFGNGFPEIKDQNLLICGLGIGVAPLLAAVDKAKSNGCHVTALLGAGTREKLPSWGDFKQICDRTILFSKDGSLGQTAFYPEMLSKTLIEQHYDKVFACGPRSMLKTTSMAAHINGVECYVSIEEHMACGVGACLSCTCATKDPDSGKKVRKKVCSDGPVFNSEEVDWNVFA